MMANQGSSEHLIERIRYMSGSSRNSSRRSSVSSSNRGSAYSEESGGGGDVGQELEKSESRESVDQESDSVQIVSKVCVSCKQEFQVQQALSVQQARQRYPIHSLFTGIVTLNSDEF